VFQAANSLSKMAEQPGGGAGAGAMGMGLGAGYGMMLPGMIRDAMQSGARVNPNQFGQGPAAAAGAAVGATAGAGQGGPSFAGLTPATSAPPADPKQLIRSVAQSAGWQCLESGDAWQIVVPVGPLRKQTVAVRFDQKDPQGHQLVSYSSICGPSTPENALKLLKFNAQMVMGAFCVQETPSGDVVAVCFSQLAATTTPLDASRVITSIAWQADKVEESLLGGDQN
jgi:hypothetical protein